MIGSSDLTSEVFLIVVGIIERIRRSAKSIESGVEAISVGCKLVLSHKISRNIANGFGIIENERASYERH